MKALALFSLLLVPTAAYAHAFGQQFTLPLPASYYILGGVGAFIASCVVIAFGTRTAYGAARTIPFSATLASAGGRVLRYGGIALLAFGLVQGVFGEQTAAVNPLVYLFWIGLVLIMPYVSAIVAGWWDTANPFRQLLQFAQVDGKVRWRYGYLPALIAYALLILLELFYSDIGTNPMLLAIILALYGCYLLDGSMRYGVQTWFRYADVFTVFANLASRLAPLRIERDALTLSSPTPRLVEEAPEHLTLLYFILFALAATAYDGFSETALMTDLIISVLNTPWRITSLAIFLLFPLLFIALYVGAIALMRLIATGGKSLPAYLLRFAYSLVPIMLAYHLAHYLPLLLYTSGVLIGADMLWYVQLIAIVSGHAYAAYVAHQIALREFPRHRALMSQLPMLALMVFYTAFGLWLLAQPFASGA